MNSLLSKPYDDLYSKLANYFEPFTPQERNFIALITRGYLITKNTKFPDNISPKKQDFGSYFKTVCEHLKKDQELGLLAYFHLYPIGKFWNTVYNTSPDTLNKIIS